MGDRPSGQDLQTVQDQFALAAEPYLSSPLSWFAWALVLPVGALVTDSALSTHGVVGAFLVWFVVVLVGGGIEGVGIRRGRKQFGTTALGGWVMRAQGNLSLVAVLLSAALLVSGSGRLVPGVWLLLLGHSFFSLGSLAFPPFRSYGSWYQLAGALALFPALVDPLLVFAGATFVGNLGVAVALWRGSEAGSF